MGEKIQKKGAATPMETIIKVVKATMSRFNSKKFLYRKYTIKDVKKNVKKPND